MPEADHSLSEDLAILRGLAREAGALALSYIKDGGKAETWQKAGGSPVTEADLAVNALCSSRLMGARPEYGWLSEETADNPNLRMKPRCWVVDPIDGTRAYIRDGDPYWCIGLAVVEAGEAVAAVIYAPELDELYEARRGGGAFLNGEQIRVSTCPNETGCRMIASKVTVNHPDWREPWPAMSIADPKPNATLLRLAFVASGIWDATFVLARKSDWDLAAGTLLVNEAGGIATTHIGETFRFNRYIPAQRSVIAAGKRLHPLLVERTRVVDLPDPQAEKRQKKQQTTEPAKMGDASEKPQLLHIVFGGELKDVTEVEFEDLTKVDFVGAFASYAEAYDAWKGAAQRTVDHAETRYFILHAHKLMDPETGDHHHV